MPPERRRYTLAVPLDASKIEGFKPDLKLKVLLKGRKEKLYSKSVKLERTGKGQAKFQFSSHPGSLFVVIGPGDASDEELLGLQTLNLKISKAKWGRKRELSLKPLRIKPYYWWWWHKWCRIFTIRGRVECPDGNPVPGAEVCAYDVDWW